MSESWKSLTEEDVQNVKRIESGCGQFFLTVVVSALVTFWILSLLGLIK